MEEHKLILYRSDGSSVTISSYFGEVTIQDSREKNTTHIMEENYFETSGKKAIKNKSVLDFCEQYKIQDEHTRETKESEAVVL